MCSVRMQTAPREVRTENVTVFRRVTPYSRPARIVTPQMFMPALDIRGAARHRHRPRPPTRHQIVRIAHLIVVHRVVVQVQGRVAGRFQRRHRVARRHQEGVARRHHPHRQTTHPIVVPAPRVVQRVRRCVRSVRPRMTRVAVMIGISTRRIMNASSAAPIINCVRISGGFAAWMPRLRVGIIPGNRRLGHLQSHLFKGRVIYFLIFGAIFIAVARSIECSRAE